MADNFKVLALLQLITNGRRKEDNVLFNDVVNTFYLRLYGDGHNMVNDYGDIQRGNLLPPLHGILFSISSKEYFICAIPQTG